MTSIKPNNGNSGIINERFLSIDIMKALAIMGMIFANAAQIYNATPFWLKHAETFGLTWVDLIAPGFLYMLALNFRISFFKTSINQKMNRRKIIFKYINRYVFLFIIGALLSIRLNEFGLYFSWDILQVLSLCGLTLFLIKRLPTIYKIIIGSIFIFLHHIFLLTPLQETIFITGNAGIFGIFSWLSFSVFTSILSNGILKEKKFNYFFIGGVLCVIIGFMLSLIFPISKKYMTSSFIFLSLGICSIIFSLIFHLYEKIEVKFPNFHKEKLFSVLAKNALFLYVIQIFLSLVTYAIFPLDLPIFIVFIIGITNIVITWFIGYLMDRIGMYIKI